MIRDSQFFCAFSQRQDDVQVCNRRKFDRHIVQGGSLIPNSGIDHGDIPGFDLRLDAARSTDADKGIRTNCDQFFDGDRCRGTANPGGYHGHLFSKQSAGICVVFSILGDMLRVIKVSGDLFAAAWVPGQKHISPNITCLHLDMVLKFRISRHFNYFSLSCSIRILTLSIAVSISWVRSETCSSGLSPSWFQPISIMPLARFR